MGGYIGPPPGSTAESIMNAMMPVGFIWSSEAADDPNSLYPGTWEKVEGQFLIGAGTLGSDTYAAGDEGGEARHTLITYEMPAHNHVIFGIGIGSTGASSASAITNITSTGNKASQVTGGNQPHENRPPYLAVNIWKRTA